MNSNPLKKLANVAFSFHDSMEGGLNIRIPYRISEDQRIDNEISESACGSNPDDEQDAFFRKFHLSQIRSRSSTQRLTNIYFQIANVQVSDSLGKSRWVKVRDF